MKSRHVSLAAAAALAVMAVACASDSKPAPAAPSATSTAQAATLSTFSGTWTSASGAGQSGVPLPNGCSQLEYKVTPAQDARSATVEFAATCAVVSVQGKGGATLVGSTLNWNAEGTVALGGAAACPFKFTNCTATPEGDGIRVIYSGTVCGVSVSGSELLRKRQ